MKINITTFKNLKTFGFVMFLFMLTLTACSSDSDTKDNNDDDPNEDLIKESYFNAASLISYQKVPCTLEDGSEGECYQLEFSSNPVDNGPFCPTTINEIGGLGFYDGATNPGFQVIKESLFTAMEADGFDIVDNNGNINIDDFTNPPDPGGYSFCLQAVPNNNLQLTFLIPVEPILASSNNNIETVELIGVTIDGVPINGDPPSVANGPVLGVGNIPAIDPCGGHHDPAGYYHMHFVAESINQVLESNGINDVSCTLVNQVSNSKLIGFAKDGFPIYAYEIEPSGLDECGGITANTSDYPNGVYHYVASNTDAPNVPKCLKGVAAINSFSFQ
ncbi:YHYH protein [Psychroserpens ponticola]|uniref:YHYH protein n=1 Tax=Psychroserpens ponticola TaxID=2932268 RepID=A0ABY7RVB0_9FLAO|nr:YHYH protein [Psychroserpens ponticola]WCO00651.1 YHYH protein [Psychroserpens ponticola]